MTITGTPLELASQRVIEIPTKVVLPPGIFSGGNRIIKKNKKTKTSKTNKTKKPSKKNRLKKRTRKSKK